jgi:hypothetical protein
MSRYNRLTVGVFFLAHQKIDPSISYMLAVILSLLRALAKLCNYMWQLRYFNFLRYVTSLVGWLACFSKSCLLLFAWLLPSPFWLIYPTYNPNHMLLYSQISESLFTFQFYSINSDFSYCLVSKCHGLYFIKIQQIISEYYSYQTIHHNHLYCLY